VKSRSNVLTQVVARPSLMEVIFEDIFLFIAKISLSRKLLMLMAIGAQQRVRSLNAVKVVDLIVSLLFEVIY